MQRVEWTFEKSSAFYHSSVQDKALNVYRFDITKKKKKKHMRTVAASGVSSVLSGKTF